MALTDSQKKDILEQIYSEKEVSFDLVNSYLDPLAQDHKDIFDFVLNSDLDDYTAIAEETWTQFFQSLGVNEGAFC